MMEAQAIMAAKQSLRNLLNVINQVLAMQQAIVGQGENDAPPTPILQQLATLIVTTLSQINSIPGTPNPPIPTGIVISDAPGLHMELNFHT